MQINMTGRHHLDITPALRSHAEKKFERLERHSDRITAVELVFDVEKLEQTAEATVFLAGTTINATQKAADLYSAIDLLIDKLDRQIIKYKEKLRSQ